MPDAPKLGFFARMKRRFIWWWCNQEALRAGRYEYSLTRYRNAPCKCGSGRKYKRCCLQEKW